MNFIAFISFLFNKLLKPLIIAVFDIKQRLNLGPTVYKMAKKIEEYENAKTQSDADFNKFTELDKSYSESTDMSNGTGSVSKNSKQSK